MRTIGSVVLVYGMIMGALMAVVLYLADHYVDGLKTWHRAALLFPIVFFGSLFVGRRFARRNGREA